jgi:hypothetical protein
MTFERTALDHAQRLLNYEAACGPGGTNGAVSRVTEKLRDALVTLTGVKGVQALLTRSLALAKREAPILRSLSVGPNGTLEGLDEISEAYSASEISRAGGILIAQLLGLLGTFIGEALTARILHNAWPDLPFDDANPQGTK